MRRSDLRYLIAEVATLCEQFMSRDKAKNFITSMDQDAIAQQDIVDEETGEVYVNAGDPFSRSELSSNYVQKSVPSRYRRTSAEDDDIVDSDNESLADTLAQSEEDVRSEWLTALAEYAANWRGFAYDHADEGEPERIAHDSAFDAADGFFREHDRWQNWATTLRMTRGMMHQAVAEFVYEEMLKSA